VRLKALEKRFNFSHLRVYFQRRFEAPRVLSDLDIPETGVCLEIGCGQGTGALLINQYAYCRRLVCVDIDQETIGVARHYIRHPQKWARDIKNGNIQFICEDASTLSFKDCAFDAVFLFGVLHHIDGWRAVIHEACRVLKVGGVFSFEDALFPSSLGVLNQLAGHVPIDTSELRRVLEDAGFSVERFEVTRRFELTSYLPGCYVRAVKGQAAVV